MTPTPEQLKRALDESNCEMRSLGVAWFRREDWPRWCEIDADFQPDYEYWLERSEAAFAQYQAAGIPIAKVMVLPDAFLEWAKAKGYGTDSNARATYVAALGAEKAKH